MFRPLRNDLGGNLSAPGVSLCLTLGRVFFDPAYPFWSYLIPTGFGQSVPISPFSRFRIGKMVRALAAVF